MVAYLIFIYIFLYLHIYEIVAKVIYKKYNVAKFRFYDRIFLIEMNAYSQYFGDI